jgi:hypothetical protein
MASGPQTGTGRTGLTRSYLEMRTCLKNWMASSFQWQSTANILRNTSQVCWLTNSEADGTHQAISRYGQQTKKGTTGRVDGVLARQEMKKEADEYDRPIR